MPDALDIRAWPSAGEIAPGLYEVSNEAYHAAAGLSSTGIKKMRVSPAEYAHGEDKETEAKSMGQLAHDALLQPDLYDNLYEVCEATRTPKRKEEAAERGVALIRPEDHERAQGMVRAIREEPDAAVWFDAPGVNEVAMYWDHDMGFLAKCKPDRACPGIGTLVDLKKTQDPRPWAFQKAIDNYLYHWSAAWYLEGASRATGVEFKDFIWVVVQEKRPHQVCVYSADREMIAEARYEMLPYLEQYRDCRERNEWPKADGSCRVISLSRKRYRRSEHFYN